MQETLEKSKNEIIRLKKERDAQIATGSTSKKEISKLTGKISLLEEEKVSQENSINSLEIKIEEKDKEIKDLEQQKQQATTRLTDLQDTYAKNLEKLEKDLKDSSSQAIRLQDELSEKTENIENLDEQKKQLVENITTLNKDLKKLKVKKETTRENSKKIQDKLDQANQNLTQSKKEIDKLFKDNKKLKKEIETFQKNDSDLQNKCDTLETELQVKTEAINVLNNKIVSIEKQLQSSKQEVEDLKTQIITTEQSRKSLEGQLQELENKENSVPIQNISPNVSPLPNLHLNNKNSEEINTTQPHSSSSSSPISSSTHTPSPSPESFNFFIKQDHLSKDDSGLANSAFSLNHSSPLILPRSQSSPDLSFISDSEADAALTQNNSTSNDLIDVTTDPIEEPSPQEQIDSFLSNSEFKNYLINRLAAEFEAAYVDAFKPLLDMPEYSGVDSASLLASESELSKLKLLTNDTVAYLLNNEDTKEEIKEAFFQIVSQAGQSNFSIEETAGKLLDKIYNDSFIGVNRQTKENYNECYQILLQASNKNQANAQQYATLLKFCGEQILSTERKKDADNYIITKLQNDLTAIDVDPKEYREPIKNTASKLTTEILNLENMLEALEKAKVNILDSNDQLKETKNILNNQCNEKIKNIIEDNFAYIFIDRILDKINSGVRLSDDEIQKLPLQLQYADSVNDFELGLKALWPNLNYLKQSAVSIDRNNCFLTARSLLRIKALARITQLNPEEFLQEITDSNAKTWLEKKLQMVTDKSIWLNLDKKQQKDLDNQFHKLFTLPSLDDMAVTLKSEAELSEELKKLDNFRSTTTTRLYKTFSEIENKLATYPNLVEDHDIAGFRYKLKINLSLCNGNNEITSEVNEEKIKILLLAINKQLENTNKWQLSNNKLIKEITNDILNSHPNFNQETTPKLVSIAVELLIEFHDLKGTIEKRTKWQNDIQQLYAFAEKWRPGSQFCERIDERKAILKAMQALKQLDINNNPDVHTHTDTEIPSDVYLPHSCSIVPNTNESYSSSYDVTINGGVFYKQNALNVGETITFEQILSNQEKQNWSVTRTNDNRLAYKTHKSWKDMGNNIKKNLIGCETSVREISLAQMIHSVQSFKDANICTLNFGDCSADMKKKHYLFVQAYNELCNDNNGLLKGPRLLCHIKNPP